LHLQWRLRGLILIGVPKLHVDVHGKVDRKDNLNLDLGIRPMEVLWPHEDEIVTMKWRFVNEFKKVLDGIEHTP
jgi:hypothetical protein